MAAELSKQVLAFWEESLNASFDYARKLALTTSLQEAASAQAELVKRQIDNAQQHIRKLASWCKNCSQVRGFAYKSTWLL